MNRDTCVCMCLSRGLDRIDSKEIGLKLFGSDKSFDFGRGDYFGVFERLRKNISFNA